MRDQPGRDEGIRRLARAGIIDEDDPPREGYLDVLRSLSRQEIDTLIDIKARFDNIDTRRGRRLRPWGLPK